MFAYRKPKSQTIIPTLTAGKRVVSNQKDISNCLNQYFCSIGENLVKLLKHCGPRDFVKYCPAPCPSSMYCNPVEPHEIQKIIGEFKSNKSPGADCIGPKLLKEISNLIISPLTHIFNLSFASRLVPDSLKLTKVILVHVCRKGDKFYPNNDRPISILSVFDKILKKTHVQKAL